MEELHLATPQEKKQGVHLERQLREVEQEIMIVKSHHHRESTVNLEIVQLQKKGDKLQWDLAQREADLQDGFYIAHKEGLARARLLKEQFASA